MAELCGREGGEGKKEIKAGRSFPKTRAASGQLHIIMIFFSLNKDNGFVFGQRKKSNVYEMYLDLFRNIMSN